MLSAEQIRNISIKKSAIGGYNMEEVDELLDKLAVQSADFEKERADLVSKIAALGDKMNDYRSSENSISTTLLMAQKTADDTVKEASEAAGHIKTDATKKAEIITSEAEKKAMSIVSAAENKANTIVTDAIAKTESMIAAAHDSVARQQMMFDRLKLEVKELRNSVLEKYKRQITFVDTLPDEVPFGPERAAEVSAFCFDQVPDYEAMTVAARSGKVPSEPDIPMVDDEEDEVNYSAIFGNIEKDNKSDKFTVNIEDEE